MKQIPVPMFTGNKDGVVVLLRVSTFTDLHHFYLLRSCPNAIDYMNLDLLQL